MIKTHNKFTFVRILILNNKIYINSQKGNIPNSIFDELDNKDFSNFK